MQNKISSLKETVNKSVDIILSNDKLGFVVKTQLASGAIGIVLTLPLAIAGYIFMAQMNNVKTTPTGMEVAATMNSFSIIPPVAVALIFVGILSLCIYGLVYININLATTLRITKDGTGNVKQIVSQSFARAVNMSLHMSLKGLILFVGFLFFIIPGILMQIKYMFSEMALIEEDLGPIQALKRSAQLTKGIKMELFKKTIALCILQIGLSIVFIPVLAISLNNPMLPIFGFMFGALLQVIGAIWYFDAVKLNGEESAKPAPEPTQLDESTPEILKPADEPKIEIPTEPNKPDEIAL